MVVAGVAVSVATAAFFALIRGGGFHAAFFGSCLAFGTLALLLAPAGQQRSYRVVETSGRIPGMPAWMTPRPSETTVRTGAVFAVTGIVLIAIALVLGR